MQWRVRRIYFLMMAVSLSAHKIPEHFTTTSHRTPLQLPSQPITNSAHGEDQGSQVNGTSLSLFSALSTLRPSYSGIRSQEKGRERNDLCLLCYCLLMSPWILQSSLPLEWHSSLLLVSFPMYLPQKSEAHNSTVLISASIAHIGINFSWIIFWSKKMRDTFPPP